jgi:hypothetical protein
MATIRGDCGLISLAFAAGSDILPAMARVPAMLASLALAATAASGAAHAAPEVYTYRVIHATYGEIGTYTNVVEHLGDDTRVDSEMHIAVKILGITVFRQEARRSEYWHLQRLVSFDGVTVTNGDKVQVRGRARDGGFAVTTPGGTVMAPADVHPSNPWCAMVLNAVVMMSTRDGKVEPVRVVGGEKQSVSLFNGDTERLHQYEIFSDRRQIVWLDDAGVTVAFRTEENGSDVDFVLVSRS